MSVFINIFEAVAVLLGMGVIGFWIISRRVLPENAFGLLSPLALDVALPALIFSNIISNFDPVAFPSWWVLPLWWAGFTLLAGLMTLLLTPLSEKRFRSEFALSLFYHNVLFLPLAVLTGMMGPDSTIITQLFLFTLFFPSLFFGTYHLFFKNAEKSIDMKKILNPVMISVLAAVAIRLANLHVLVP
ncbi:MAG: AEC family transporter, partial [Desulfobacterales bacterium]|nr:AEC family transporter [Desulfobacterales bacterium]